MRHISTFESADQGPSFIPLEDAIRYMGSDTWVTDLSYDTNTTVYGTRWKMSLRSLRGSGSGTFLVGTGKGDIDPVSVRQVEAMLDLVGRRLGQRPVVNRVGARPFGKSIAKQWEGNVNDEWYFDLIVVPEWAAGFPNEGVEVGWLYFTLKGRDVGVWFTHDDYVLVELDGPEHYKCDGIRGVAECLSACIP